MHAQLHAVPVPSSCLVPVSSIRPGQHFIRVDSPSEVLVLMTYAGADAIEGEFTWAVVVATNHDSEGYVPGQLLKLKQAMHVRRVHEAKSPVFALEH